MTQDPMPLDTAAARACLEGYTDPWLGRRLGELGALRSVAADGGALAVSLVLPVPVGDYAAELEDALVAQLARAGISAALRLTLSSDIPSHAVQPTLKPLAKIRNVVAVASGKGGVGKSTVAANLALAWAAAGARVGLLDADIYGPSQPIMLGLAGQRPTSDDGKRINPLLAHGVKAMSIGALVDPDQAMVWRGPMATQALTQLLSDTDWGELDYLVVDMPPGTGDIQLTLSQRVPVAGAVVVTTPQDIALADARKGINMFQKVAVPVLGVVENMSLHVCSACGHAEAVFGEGGGERLAAESGTTLLGRLPLDARIRAEADGGTPSIMAAPESARARAFREFARRTAAALAGRAKDRSSAFPKIVVEGT
ncbi:MAG: iron-sulfur cluster carrier protein ApbC [Pseudomonadota bacterium]|jgi:ATP-binding protein involved in chromosome partitioning